MIIPVCCLSYNVHTCCNAAFTSILLTSVNPIPYAVSNKHPQSGFKHKPNNKKRFGIMYNDILHHIGHTNIQHTQHYKEK